MCHLTVSREVVSRCEAKLGVSYYRLRVLLLRARSRGSGRKASLVINVEWFRKTRIMIDVVSDRSTAAIAVGRRVSIIVDAAEDRPNGGIPKRGIVVAFDPKTNQHRISFDGGAEKGFNLNYEQFKWLVASDKAAD